nr:ATP-binding protein [Actinacidiphila guanduensis]
MNGAVGPEPEGPVPPARSGVRGFADRWPFRRKLDLLVGVPLVVVAALLAYVISGLVGQAQDAASAARLVRDSRQVAELVDRVQTEHQQAILLSVRYESATSGTRPSLTPYRQAQQAVQQQVDTVRRTFGSRLPPAEAQVLKEIEGMSSLRSTVEQSYLPADNIDPAYTSAVDDLIDGLGLDLSGNLSTTRTGSLLDSLLRAEAAHSTFETSVFSAQTGDANALIEFTQAVGAQELYTSEAARFGRYATAAQTSQLSKVEQGRAWNTISLQYAGLQVDPSALERGTPQAIRTSLDQALRAYPDYRTQAQTRLTVTGSLIGQIAHRADSASRSAWWRAAWLLGATLLGFAVWLLLSVAIRRSVIRPVQALTGAAAEVAEVAGQELARVADDDAEDSGPPRLREMPITARDEIGDLAAAFNRVQTTAAALLERQVLSRRNTAEMFGNVGRRVSNLTARQLSLIDAVERGETDPELLERLYRIDHLAVRLQRNADSLMLLAGIRESGMEASPTALTNVVRASLGQIEGYQRVSLTADTEVTVAPDIIADLTLMLAELLENAVSFSPALSPVEVAVRSGAEGALIEVRDHGLGMSAERLAEENARLIRRERLDLVPTKVLGLFVVGSLARRWGIRVMLTRTPGGGVTAQVAIPSSLLLMTGSFAEPSPQRADTGAQRAAYGPGPYGGQDRQPAQDRHNEHDQYGQYGQHGQHGQGGPYGQQYQPQQQAEPARAQGPQAEPQRRQNPYAENRRTPSWAPYPDADEHPQPPARPEQQYAQPFAERPAPSAPFGGPMGGATGPQPGRGQAYGGGPQAPYGGERPQPAAAPGHEVQPALRPGQLEPLPRRVPRRTAQGGGPQSAPGGPSQVGNRQGLPSQGTPQGPQPDQQHTYRPNSPYDQRNGRQNGRQHTGRSGFPQDPYAAGSGVPGYPNGTQNGAQNGTQNGSPYGGPDGYSSEPRSGLPGGYRDASRNGGYPEGSGPAGSLPRRAAGRHAGAPAGSGEGGSGRPTEAGPAHARPEGEARPLRRRVRGATLGPTFGGTSGQPMAARPRVADADEVRSELDEFEAAVERAHRDTAAAADGGSGGTTRNTGFPEGAEE